MRITGGDFRSRALRAPVGAATRPTSDRVRESLFAVLGNLVDLDGADLRAVQADLQSRLPNTHVYTRQEFHNSIVSYLIRAQLGISFGTSTAFAVIVGFVIVALSMFSAVVDNVREFGTLKAMGATTLDLAKLLFVQASSYAFLGTTIGLFLVTRMAEGMRSPNLSLVLPPELFVGTYVLMALLCVFASSLALWRVRNVEPGMVFR